MRGRAHSSRPRRGGGATANPHSGMSDAPLAADPLRSGRGIFELQSFASIRSPMPKATMGARLEPISSPRESPRAPNRDDGHQIHEEFQRLCQSSPVPKATMGARLEPKRTMPPPPPPPPPPGQYQVGVRPSIPTAEESQPRVSGFGAASPPPTAPGAPSATASAASPHAPSPRQRITPTRLPEGGAP